MQKYIDGSMSFEEYKELIKDLAAAGRTTGIEQTGSRVNFTKLNRYRMARLEKSLSLIEDVIEAAQRNSTPMIWLIVTEAWCGDAAQNIPVIEKIASESVNIETRYILRDENLELIDNFLENGSRSIPKLISLDPDTLHVLGTWGSRPTKLKDYFLVLKEQGLDKTAIGELLQRWYNDDRGRSLQREFTESIRKWGGVGTAAIAIA